MKNTSEELVGFLTLPIIDGSPTLQDEIAKAMIAANAISESELPAIGSDSVELAQAFGSIILQIDSVTKLVDQLADLHPIAKAAWTVVSMVYMVRIGHVGLHYDVSNLPLGSEEPS